MMPRTTPTAATRPSAEPAPRWAELSVRSVWVGTTDAPRAAARPARPRAGQRRARAAVLWGLAVFAASQAALAAAIPYHWPELRDPNYAYKAQRLHHLLRESRPRRLVVMLGSSRTGFGLVAGPLSGLLTERLGESVTVFNFGVPAAGPMTNLLNLERLLGEGVRPDLLLVEVLPPFLAGQCEYPAETSWLPAPRLGLADLDRMERCGFPVAGVRREWWQTRPVPCYAHRFGIVTKLVPCWLPWNMRQDWSRGTDPWGWTGHPTIPATDEQRERVLRTAWQQYNHYLVGFRPGGPTCAAVRQLLELCRRERLTAALVLMPEGTRFRGWYPPGAWEGVEEFLDRLSREYDTPLVNGRTWLADECFSDGHHLLTGGACRFTERLGREALLPLLRQQREQAAATLGGMLSRPGEMGSSGPDRPGRESMAPPAPRIARAQRRDP